MRLYKPPGKRNEANGTLWTDTSIRAYKMGKKLNLYVFGQKGPIFCLATGRGDAVSGTYWTVTN